uniref:Uncharacterized protein n=1 Tax=viral metagenome TaxID=1070528 RepID=A0A6M3XV57_9ZZZZ
MADRILVWSPSTHDAVFYLDEDYSPDALRIHAKDAPTLGDLVVDILDDGVSVMETGTNTIQKMTKTNGQIWYGTYSGTFQVGELVSGGSSGAYGEVISTASGMLEILHTTPTTAFTVTETITGATSLATATVDAWVAPQEYDTPETTARTSNARLGQGETLNEEAEDFGPDKPTLQKGSLVTLSILKSGGANGVTVQLELSKVT